MPWVGGEYGEFLVTFVDNHDQVGQNPKCRFGYGATPEQIVAVMGFDLRHRHTMYLLRHGARIGRQRR